MTCVYNSGNTKKETPRKPQKKTYAKDFCKEATSTFHLRLFVPRISKIKIDSEIGVVHYMWCNERECKLLIFD